MSFKRGLIELCHRYEVKLIHWKDGRAFSKKDDFLLPLDGELADLINDKSLTRSIEQTSEIRQIALEAMRDAVSASIRQVPYQNGDGDEYNESAIDPDVLLETLNSMIKDG